MRHHAAVHRQPLGAAHPGYGDGAVEGAGGELLDLGRAAGAHVGIVERADLGFLRRGEGEWGGEVGLAGGGEFGGCWW